MGALFFYSVVEIYRIDKGIDSKENEFHQIRV